MDKVLEIIAHILSEIKLDKNLNEIDMKELNKEGYTDAEIKSAFDWIFSKINSGEKIVDEINNRSGYNRFLNKYENGILTTEAKGYLIQLKELGLLSNVQIESIIDKLIITGYQNVSKEDINLLVSSQATEDIHGTGNKLLLQNSETIH